MTIFLEIFLTEKVNYRRKCYAINDIMANIGLVQKYGLPVLSVDTLIPPACIQATLIVIVYTQFTTSPTLCLS